MQDSVQNIHPKHLKTIKEKIDWWNKQPITSILIDKENSLERLYAILDQTAAKKDPQQ